MPKDFDPIKVGPIHLKNRIVAEPVMSNSGSGGYVTKNLLDLHAERSALHGKIQGEPKFLL